MGRLENKVTIITGATSGIGQRTAEVFIEEGAFVVLSGRREELGMKIAAELGSKAHFIRTDVTEEDQVKAMIDQTMERYGRLDCLFNNAGGPAPVGGIASIPLEGFEKAMAVLFRSVFLGIKHAAPIMQAQGMGSIINNASVASLRGGLSSSTIYSAAKAAVVQLTVCTALELGEHNVRVNCISPGGIATGIFGKAIDMTDEEAEKTTEKVEKMLAGIQPIPRAGQPEDIARTALFLASDDSTFINGHNLVVDGGLIGGRSWSQQQEKINRLREMFGESADL
ncbi:MAG: glucose 1-dehydrogenase [SAR324 cluster bacterium]|nr:glucose 1-dehydrogenase [SAR324 cluster bacterium]